MKKLMFLLPIVTVIFSSCNFKINKNPEPSKPKLTNEQLYKQEYEQRLETYHVTFLFECDRIKVYRFYDGKYVYFTNANGMSEYQYTTRVSKCGHQTHKVQSINTRK